MATSHRKDGASGKEYLPTGGGVTWAAGPPIRSLSEMLFCSFDYDLVGHCELLRNMHALKTYCRWGALSAADVFAVDRLGLRFLFLRSAGISVLTRK
jgi:hypothetical protein